MTQTTRYFTGVGSRKAATNLTLMAKLTLISELCCRAGYVLRSGGALGADTAFEQGAAQAGGRALIYTVPITRNFQSLKDALELAEYIHPAWERCSEYAKLLHARNCFQVLGANLKTPSTFLVCWTPGAQAVGGTRTAIKLAEMKGIPVYNVADKKQQEALLEALDSTFR